MNLKNSVISCLVVSACLAMLIGTLSSCNKKTEKEEDIYMPASSVAVTNFSLKSKNGSKVKIDSVFFSIDLNRGVIFNADSLPVGTDVTKLVPVISYTSSASAVTLTQSGGKYTGEIDYKSHPSDSVDFSGKVVLKITAEDKTTTRSYNIKVNVHKMEPDSLMWDRLAVTPMPSRLGAPKQQKTIGYKGTSYSFIKEADDSYTLAVATDLLSGEWNKQIPTLDFEPDVRTLNSTAGCMYILDTAGVLHTSADGLAWDNTGSVWTNIIGAYGDVMLGMRSEGGTLVHTCWPVSAGYAESPVSEDFPVTGYTDFVQFSNRWTTLPIGFMVGGRLADGTFSDKTWGFDGDHWAVLSEGMTPPVSGATLVPYFVYRKTSSSLVQTEFSVWMLIGGLRHDGKSNRIIYVSYDNGVNWYAADKQMQLPDYFPGLWNLDGIMAEWPKQASLTGNWSEMSSRGLPGMARVKYEVKDYEVYWDCPYIYIFGGMEKDGSINDEVWRGVLNRLTFIPQF
ncbi:MAG: hypothetical protein K2H22_07100 [Muribaculaceae bacterium]|nr:hypothetical protein [Muribaculaceae bacterium]